MDAWPCSSWLQGADVPLGHRAGNDFVAYMHDAGIVPADGVCCHRPTSPPRWQREWRVAFASDPDGSDRRIVPLRIEEVDPPGLLKGRVHADLFGTSKEIARERFERDERTKGPPETSGVPASDHRGVRRGAPVRVRPRFQLPAAIRTSPAVRRAGRTARRAHAGIRRHVRPAHGGRTVSAASADAAGDRVRPSVPRSTTWSGGSRRPPRTRSLAQEQSAAGVPDGEDTARQITCCSKRAHARRWLLIYDNAEWPDEIEVLLPRPEGHVLVTSRWSAWRKLGESIGWVRAGRVHRAAARRSGGTSAWRGHEASPTNSVTSLLDEAALSRETGVRRRTGPRGEG